MAKRQESPVNKKVRSTRSENTVPWFWPFEFAAAAAQAELSLSKRGLQTKSWTMG